MTGATTLTIVALGMLVPAGSGAEPPTASAASAASALRPVEGPTAADARLGRSADDPTGGATVRESLRPNAVARLAAQQPRRAASDQPPRRLRIPVIAVDAVVIDLGVAPDGTLRVPSTADEVGWWSGGSPPGQPGPAVLVGHVDWSGGPAVFFRLDELSPGDAIEVIDSKGIRHRFTVERIESHDKDRFPTDAVYGDTEAPTLRLVTCGGNFDAGTGHYTENVIIFATS